MVKNAIAKGVLPREPNDVRVIAAAIKCLEKYGPAKTTMEDIASEAGVGRQTLYRTFSTRTALFDAIALQRLLAMRDRMKQKVDAYPTLEGAMIDGTLDVRALARKDKVFMALVEAAGDRGLERYLLHPSSAVREVMKFIWTDIFARARKRGELRTDLSDMEIADWLRVVNFTLLLREDLATGGQKALLRTFVLPALMPQKPAPERAKASVSTRNSPRTR